MLVKNFWGPPQKSLAAKNIKIWHNLGQLQSSAANISGTEEDIPNWTSVWSTAIPPALGE